MSANNIPKILIVDDKDSNLISLERTLSDVNAEFIRAKSGNEALKKVIENDFAVILMDVQMPDMNGFETIQLMHNDENTKQIPVIFISAVYKDEFDKIRGIKTGGVDFITKPINTDILIGKIKIFLDLYEGKQALLDEIERRKILEKEKEGILAVVSHDLKSPLSVIQSCADLILTNQENDLSSQITTYIDKISKSSQAGLTLVHSLLDQSRVDGTIHLDYDSFNIKELILECADNLSLKFKSKNIAYWFDFSEEFKIKADYGRLTQVITNLLENAFKYTPKNGFVKFSTKTADVKFENSTKKMFQLSISDNGLGIPMGKLESIFEKFEQAREDDKAKGTGLGLSICKRIISLHNGKIWAEQNKDKGATFNIALPNFEIIQNQTTIDMTKLNIVTIQSKGCPINDMLKRLGYPKANVHYDRKSGWKNILDSTPNLVIIDLDVPLEDDSEQLQVLRQNSTFANLPVIIYSENTNPETLASLSDENTSFLSKPLNMWDIEEQISKLLADKPSLETSASPETKTVMVVDDEDIIRFLLMKILEDEGYNTIQAKNGLEASFLFRKHHIDMIISDIRMPAMDGKELAKYIQISSPNTPLAFISAFSSDLLDKKSSLYNPDRYISKPFQKKQIIDLVKKCIGKPQKVNDDNTKSVQSKIEKLSILLADDSEENQFIIKSILKKQKHISIDIVENGNEVMNKLSEKKFDVILMDIQMPELDGYETTKKIRKSKIETPVIALTAHTKDLFEEKAIASGMNDFLEKPITEKTLLNILSKNIK
jgi:CheY-like chemotaxis protein